MSNFASSSYGSCSFGQSQHPLRGYERTFRSLADAVRASRGWLALADVAGPQAA
jgi:hypothetical protein